MADALKLVALDMDGTLLTNKETLSTHTKEIIAKALEQEVHVVISTGRWLDNCYSFAEELNLNSYLISSNGGEIWTMDKELIDRHLLKAEMVEKLYEMAQNLGLNTWMVTTNSVYRDGKRPDDFYIHYWLKFGCDSLEKEKLDEFVNELSYYEELELSNSLPTNVEVNPIGVNKAAALKKVCDLIGISMNNVMAVGDSLNDIKMIQQAGLGVAMGNAQQAIKNVADHVTDTNDHDGVAKAIERFILK
ncbi:Cof-type HAD-IIB family hydrolase [Oceanobacillus halotolerans]|uniref:Cof-type HAD-IIB family hydrolase n=1 Tax=Oceanobacillus halotolerans TaxID=2663380 RepID=UPI0013DBBC2B|nr:Cof-type HAD-IIB family hydrolase [Oceanobacillus halotolerans]